ncbi:MAG: 16S rRNA (guanine(966)-N(2))-methyltransferase RsmD [Clostridia bacterium]|nr:16S rRNA (guanine(966)-N(2))-methyltransferase RsmD [Clostridia bacterium]
MRIVSGKYRGRKLKEFDLATTRPTIDRVKEAIFNLIQFDVADAVVLDLFSGTGALGIEAISRGAKKTYLIDNNDKAIQIIKENTKNMTEDFEIIKTDYMLFLSKDMRFDIVLLDPPYATDCGLKAIEYILERNMLNKGGVIVFETSDNKDISINFKGLSVDRRKYGTVAVYIIRNNNED